MSFRGFLPRIAIGVSLSLATGASALVFGAVWGVVLRPLPYRQPSRLVGVWDATAGTRKSLLSYAEFRSLTKASAFSSVAAYGPGPLGQGGVSPNVFHVFGVRPALGRDFDASDVGGPACICSYDLWENQLQGDTGRVGTVVSLGSEKCQLIGVMPRGFQFGLGAFTRAGADAVWTASDFPKDSAHPISYHELHVVARLAPGVSKGQASAALRSLSALLAQPPGSTPEFRMYLVPLSEQVAGESATVLGPLLLSVLALMLLTAANLACFTSLRLRSRLRSLAIRTALGAGQSDVLVAALREPLLDTTASAAAGLLLGWWGLRILPSEVSLPFSRWYSVAMDWHTAAFVGVCALAMLAFSALPALLLIRRRDLSLALRPGGPQTTVSRRGRVGRRSLSATVALQFAVSFSLLAGVGAMFLTLRGLLRPASLGFNPRGLVSAFVRFPPAFYERPSAARQFLAPVEAAVKALPGVRSVAAAEYPPLTGGFPFRHDFRLLDAGQTRSLVNVSVQVVSPGYFRTLGVPLIRGRLFETTDGAGSAPVAILNHSFVERYLRGRNPLAARLAIDTSPKTWNAVVGVVGDVRDGAITSAPRPEVYLVAGQSEFQGMSWILVRSALPPEALTPEILAAVRKADPATGVYMVQSMKSAIREATATRRVTLWAMAAFGFIALLVASSGLYSIVGYLSNLSLHDYAVRIAMGSTPGGVFANVMKRAAGIAGIGLALGLPSAWVMSYILRSLVYGIAPTSPSVLAATAGVLALVSLLAAYPPARAAARIDPARLLKEEQ